ncbi:hypothetical protein [Novosphingobium huizhouense]|uniref:hypothetical protein n=1 Tax=Novosphingobium huizhouense TaxID=2866625 RepID=UPI001CD86C72|nr:hypothetical protein [Novosphingobium huizhouense]
MSGSEAEERIRLKVEAALRMQFPEARIIHELVVRQGSCRLDLAAVTPNRIVLVEIKSEKDVLKRLDRQTKEAEEVADLYRVVVAAKHLDKAREATGWGRVVAEDDFAREIGTSWSAKQLMGTPCNAPARLAMLWANELRIVAETGARVAREASILRASEYFTGAEVRKRVCAALRARPFTRADAPILSDLFPTVTQAAA